MFEYHEQRRIELTASCRDADALPKVPEAGEVVERDGARVQVMHNGVVIEEGCYYGAWMTEVIRRLRGHHEPQEEAAFHLVAERLRSDTPEPVMLELGSFWAYYSLWLAHAVPTARCVCVEPDPAYLQVGRRNAALNGAALRFVQAAVGPADGGVASFTCESDGLVRELPVASVDGLVEREGLPRIDLLLCDTQGAEVDMLAGAREAIAAGRLRFVVVSTHHHNISGDPLTHRRCLDTVTSGGGHVIAEHSVAESFSGDGLIVASFDPRDTDLELALTHARARDSLFGELEPDLAAAFAERDAAVAERDALAAERDRLAAEVGRLSALEAERRRSVLERIRDLRR